MSLWSDFKNIAWYLADRRLLPSVKVAYGARVGTDCQLGKAVLVGADARVYDSQLGDRVRIDVRSQLSGCRLENDIVIGPGCELGGVELGRYSYIAHGARAGRISFGRFCSVGPEFASGLGDHPTDRVSSSPIFYSTQRQCGTTFADKNYFQEGRPTRVGNDVWIGARVFIRDGVTIGDGAMIGAGAVVVKDVPPYAVVGGVPARKIRSRFSEDVVRELQSLAWWNWDEAKLRKAQPTLSQTDPQDFLSWAKTA